MEQQHNMQAQLEQAQKIIAILQEEIVELTLENELQNARVGTRDRLIWRLVDRLRQLEIDGDENLIAPPESLREAFDNWQSEISET